jgi:hypothetical protein
MTDFNVQQVPDECAGPVTIGGYVVTLVDIEDFNGEFRWIYRVDNVNAPGALSNWVLEIDAPCRELITAAFATERFPSTQEIPPPLLELPESDFDNPGQTPNNQTCPEGPCAGRVQGVAFIPDQEILGELQIGFSQLFAFTISEEATAELGCVSISGANTIFCGQVCVPGDCTFICPNACECTEENNTFTCEVTVPLAPDGTNICFGFPTVVDAADVLFGFCIGEQVIIAPTEEDACQAPAEVTVCDQTLFCCCDVFPWTRTVTLDIQINVPLTAECQTENLYECCYERIVVEQTCFTCNVDDNPFLEFALECEDIDVAITSVDVSDDGTSAVINYTVDLTGCAAPVGDNGNDLPGTPAPPAANCPPPAPTVRNTQANVRQAQNRSIKRRR